MNHAVVVGLDVPYLFGACDSSKSDGRQGRNCRGATSVAAYLERFSLGLIGSITADSSRGLVQIMLHGQAVHL